MRSARAILGALTGLNLLNYLDRYVTAAVLPLIVADFRVSDLRSGILQSLFIVTYSVVSPIAGWMTDLRPRLRLAAAGVLLWSVATLASGFAPTFMMLLLARAMSGVGEATYATVTPSLIADSYAPDRRGRALAIFYAALPVGTALAYALGGSFVGARYGWRAAFLIVAGPAVLMSALLFLLEEPKRGKFDTGGPVLTPPSIGASLRALGRRKSYVLNSVAQIIFTFSLGGIAYWVPTFLVRERNLSLARANLNFGIVLVSAGIIGTVGGGYLGDALARRYPGAHFTLSGIATIAAVPFIATAILTRNPYVLWPCTWVGLFLLFIITGPLTASIINVLPADLRGRGVAVYTVAIHLLGDALSPALIGFASDRIGLELPVLVTVLLLAVAGVVLLAGKRALVRDLAAMQ